MNKFFLFVAITASAQCQAATGSARDGELAFLIVITILLMPVAVVYLIHFLKDRISDIKKHAIDHKGEI